MSYNKRPDPMISASCTGETAFDRVLDTAEATARLEDGQIPCFAAGTLVHTKEGLKPIEDIRAGDLVLSYPDDQKTPARIREEHEYTYRRVTQTFVTDHQPLSKLIVSHLDSGKRETIFVTENHPIYNSDRGWTPVSDIRVTDALENYYFGNLMVARVYHKVENARVYNFEVEDFHTYYVGELGVWVHNKCEVESRKIASIEALTDKVEIYKKQDWRNYADKDSAANTGKIGEEAGNIALYESTGKDFQTNMRNKSNNGVDEWFLDERALADGGKAKLYVGDEKASIVGKYPSVEGLKLNAKVEKWMYEGSGEAFIEDGTYNDGLGRLNNQVLDASVRAEFRSAYDLWKAGKLDITTFIMEVKVSKAGTSFTYRVSDGNASSDLPPSASTLPQSTTHLSRQT